MRRSSRVLWRGCTGNRNRRHWCWSGRLCTTGPVRRNTDRRCSQANRLWVSCPFEGGGCLRGRLWRLRHPLGRRCRPILRRERRHREAVRYGAPCPGMKGPVPDCAPPYRCREWLPLFHTPGQNEQVSPWGLQCHGGEELSNLPRLPAHAAN